MSIKILVLCTGNSCRSQIAEGYLKYFGGDRAEIYSAGVETHGVNPRAIATMQKDGIDISGQTSDLVTKFLNTPFDHVITVCDHASERCPVIPGKHKRHHHNFPDPAKAIGTEDEIEMEFNRVRNLIKEYCRNFVIENF